MQWFYLDANQQQVPADENDLGSLVQGGVIQADTLLWNETLSDWQGAAVLFPSWFAAPAQPETASPKLAAARPATIGMVKRPIKTAAGGGGPLRRSSRSAPEPEAEVEENPETIKDLASFLAVNAGWMKFLGVMLIIVGVGYCLSIVGAIVGWLPIWLGVLIFKAAGSAVSAQITGHTEELEDSLERIALWFKLQGIFLLVTVILMVTGIVLSFTMGLMGLLMAAQEGVPN